MKKLSLLLLLVCFGSSVAAGNDDVVFSLKLRSKIRTENDWNQHQFKYLNQKWKAGETAIIVCDFWDYHHCLNAVRRMEQFGPRLNRVVDEARKKGATIIHSPSDCMDAYVDHPARKRTLGLPSVGSPDDIQSWCSKIPGEEKAHYPIDQSDGGEDDDPDEHRKWANKLQSLGRNPNMPWQMQNDMIRIDEAVDYVSDKGNEVWNVLQAKKIKNVILVGVHTNMCVLGRPFGLRQMKRNGMNVVLMRDMTDTMYNPQRWPYVSHFAGTDLVISHIEKFVCPTISSDQIIGGDEFTFKTDPRPHLAIVVGEREYKTEQTLPDFAEKYLRDFRVTFVHANKEDRNDFPGIEKVKEADLMLVSVRRRILKPEQMKIFKEFEAAKKPILGIRTASHAFSLRGKDAPDGYEDWKEFDGSVFGGSYTNHYGNKLKSKVTYTEGAIKHPITSGNAVEKGTKSGNNDDLKVFGQGGSLYKTAPLAQGTKVLMMGTVLGQPPEPVAWTFARVNGGKSFYTSMGHPEDFKNPEFVSLLRNALRWAAGKVIETKTKTGQRWTTIDRIKMPANKDQIRFEFESKKKLTGLHARLTFRKVVRFPKEWSDREIKIRIQPSVEKCWINGKLVERKKGTMEFILPNKAIEFGDANWISFGAKLYADQKNDVLMPIVFAGKSAQVVKGKWEWSEANADYSVSSKIFLPAKFGGSTDVFVDLEK